ncbi:uncharacterized protein LOC116788453 [Chiroxiphia lanceolata]|uniref:uncharacterized protein LOC116788453 n=1 Tax=Chiroxiphia lanceolata TaxID=296741 RepID=UPI0013CE84A8|nr:uncharacterized protein LOC116788453 [Chiroxiphia lanceolata]
MAGRRSGLRRLLRLKRKREGPGAASEQQPEEMQHFQPLQQDPGQERTEEQDRPRGRFRRAVQRFLKFMGIRRRTPRTTAPEVMAEPDTRTTEIKEKPDVSTAPINPMEISDTAVTEDTANPDTALADLTVKADIELTHCTAKPDTALADDTIGSDTAATDVMAKADMAPMPTDGTSNSDGASMDSTAKPDTAFADDRPSSDIDIVARTDCPPMSTDGTSSSATTPMDDTAKPESALTQDTINAETKPTDLMAEGDAMTEGIRNDDTTPTQSVTDAPNLYFFQEKGVSSRKQVLAIVRYIHQCLTSHVSPDVRQHIDIRRLTEAHPCDVVTTLLHCAPACDRAAAMMWSSIASSGTTMEKVLPTLLGAIEDWPVHNVSTSNGDDTDIFALAATLALWLIIQEPKCQEDLTSYAPQLLVALLFQIFMSTEQMPEEVSTFWRGCQEEHGLPSNPNRFAVQTLKGLLCRLHWENEVVAIERKCGWETLLCCDTHHYAVGLLAREMRSVLVPFHSQMTIHLIGLLSRDQPRWELPALAFLVELLDYLDGRECHDRVLPILSRNLQSQCPDRRRLALRGLLVLSVDPSMAESICSLAESLLELLHHEDGELVGMTLSVFLNVLRDEDLQTFSSAAPKLAEALRPLFDNDNSHVQLLSIRLFRELMELAAEEGKTDVHQSLVPFFRWDDENQCMAEVPAIVRYIHQCLTSHVSPDVRQHIDIRRLADTNPHEVVMTLLHCAPACDRAAAMMWSSIASSGTTVEKVLPTLLGAIEDWPVHNVSTSDGDDTDIFALAATLALWLIIQEPECQDVVINYAPHLLVALLFQIFMSTEQMPEEVSTFWRGCQEEYGLPSNPNRFAVQTLKALLCRLHWENEVVAIERKCGWETLLCCDTHHYAVGLLAREMRSVLVPFHSQMTIHLLGLLSRDQPRWELPALAFLVELLDYLDGRKCHDRVLPILSRNLQSQCPDRRRLALRGLLVLSVDPSMAESVCSLAESLLALLHHEDGELVGMTLSVFLNVLRDEDLQAFSSAAPKLAEALLSLFDNDNSHVRLLSIRLFREMMDFLAEEGQKTLVQQSPVPLFFHCYDENQCVAEASRETLLCAASFLKRRDLEQLLRKQQHLEFCDCLMDKDVSRRDEHLRQALPYLQSPQQPLREVAIRFMGVAAWHTKDLQPIMKALEVMSEDDCPSYSTMRTAALSAFRRAVTKSSSPSTQPASLQQQ